MDKQLLAEWLWPLLCPEVGYRSYWTLLCKLGSPAEIMSLSRADFARMGMEPELVMRLRPERKIRIKIEAEIEKTHAWLEASGKHHLIVPGDTSYPDLLREIDDPPPLLFAAGNLSALNYPSVALVGSRNCTPYGARVTQRLASDMSAAGFVISSGLAVGIDAVAHNSCVKRKKPTIAILGSGLANMYPRGNRRLAQNIVEQDGLLLSEFPLSAGPAKYRFPQRNRLISGVSLATCVVEASLRSGSLITARTALDQNRQVFAVPGSVDSQNSRGCHRLLREGAAVAENAADIKEMLEPLLLGQLELMAGRSEADGEGKNTRATSLTEQEALIIKHVQEGAVDTDALLSLVGMTVSALQQSLARLELSGHLVSHSGKWFLGHTLAPDGTA
jgi:DNA processing protein